MRRLEMKKQYILGILIFVIVLVTVGFALLQSSLSINGTVSTKSNSWNIYFDNIVLNQDSVSKTAPTISNRTALSFNVELDKPGDLYEFSVDAVNDGTLDAMINNITATNLTVEQAKLIDLSYTYEDGASISSKDYLKASTRETIKVSVKYKEDISSTDLTNSNISLPISIAIEYVQADENAKEREVTPSKVWSLREDNDNSGNISIGDLICVSTECFYVYDTETTPGQIKALAQYNLMIGNEYDSDSNIVKPLTNPTGLQSSQARGLVYNDVKYYGTVEYALSREQNNYSDSVVKEYVDAYKTKIDAMKANTINASLITYAELYLLGCNNNSNNVYNCDSAPSWVYLTSYWVETNSNISTSYIVDSSGFLCLPCAVYSEYKKIGVRPVITINASEFE